MGLNTDISEVIKQIDKIITSKDGKWLDVADYNLKSKDRKNMKSVYGLIHDILHHSDNDQRINEVIESLTVKQTPDSTTVEEGVETIKNRG